MTDRKHQRLRSLFDRALDLPRAQRAAFLERECGGDAELRARVEALLVAAEDERFLASPTGSKPSVAADASDESAAPLREGPGTRIGPYNLLQLIGEGGFGAVFMAEQEKPVARKVALKIIKLGMDTRQVVARFEQERQALALMDHPNIARVIDAGATETGRPFFVMDLVEGEPIVEYCDAHSLTIDERLELFEQVCHAVQHAHSKGIIHRDLKPSNVLVATQDGRARVKVIDFGIAKATSAKLTDKTLFTEHHQIIGTLQYMSPEQAEGSLDIDTRTDVYALGVMLYELLTGSTPFDALTLRNAFYSELQRMIREVEPPKPSTRLHESADTLATIAAHRRVEPKRLGTIVRGELDWIVMKALEKDRARRYESAHGLALDIRRYLGGEAVVAAPPSRAYRLRKFVRRNQGAVAAFSLIALTLLGGMTATSLSARWALREKDSADDARDAERAAREAETAAKEDALHQASIAREVNQFLTQDLLSAVDPTRTQNRQITVREVVDTAAARIGERFASAPVIGASIEDVLGQLYHRLGELDRAHEHTLRAYELFRSTLGETDRATLEVRGNIDDLNHVMGHDESGIATAEESIRVMTDVLGADDRLTLANRTRLASMLAQRGEFERADSIFRDTLERQRRVLGPSHRETVATLNELALSAMQQQKFDVAEPLLVEALDLLDGTLGEQDPDAMQVALNLAWSQVELGRTHEAEELTTKTLALARRVLGNDHFVTQIAVNNLGAIYARNSRYDLVEPLYIEGLESARRTLGPDHPDLVPSVHNLGKYYLDRKQLEKAEPLLAEASDLARRVLAPDDAGRGMCIQSHGECLLALGRAAEAIESLREAHEILGPLLDPAHPGIRRLCRSMAAAYAQIGDEESAVSWRTKAAAPSGQ